ncbi:MAG: FAD-dependent monooxygenase, partial [Caldilineaceae bacterium]|nr:FAD-dependent monooxygenase [Caldilineaceae bacterium]
INFRIIDKKPTFSENSRALIVQPRTMELFEQMGIAETFLAQGTHARGLTLHTKHWTKDFNVFATGADQTRYNFGVMIEQTKTERILHDYLQQAGHQLEWETELTQLEQMDRGVHLTLRHADGTTESLMTRYLIAADGASSTVRKQTDVAFVGETVEQRFVIMDATVAEPLAQATMDLNFNPNGPIGVIPLSTPDRFRIISTLPKGYTGAEPTVEDFQRFLKQNFPGGLTTSDPAWFSIYHIHSRSVAHFNVGNIFFVGDAAHVHTPLGGQGMNTGLQDAHNLAWKLALVLRNQLPVVALDSYHAERWPVAHRLVTTTDRLFELISNDSPLASFVRVNIFPPLLRFVMRLPGVQRRVFPILAMTGIRYADGFFVKTQEHDLPKNAPVAGERWPYVRFASSGSEISSYSVLDYTKHHLFIFTPKVDKSLRAQAAGLEQSLPLRVHFVLPKITSDQAVPALTCDNATFTRFSKSGETSIYLVRPDAYVALAQRLTDADLRSLLATYFDESDVQRQEQTSHQNLPTTV